MHRTKSRVSKRQFFDPLIYTLLTHPGPSRVRVGGKLPRVTLPLGSPRL